MEKGTQEPNLSQKSNLLELNYKIVLPILSCLDYRSNFYSKRN